MRNQFQNPIDFNINIKGININYNNLMEVNQGGPQVGSLTVNGNLIETYLFGRPLLNTDKFIFVPAYIKKFLGWHFKLAKINIKKLDVELIGKGKSIIFLEKIESGYIYFFEDINKTKINRISVESFQSGASL